MQHWTDHCRHVCGEGVGRCNTHSPCMRKLYQVSWRRKWLIHHYSPSAPEQWALQHISPVCCYLCMWLPAVLDCATRIALSGRMCWQVCLNGVCVCVRACMHACVCVY